MIARTQIRVRYAETDCMKIVYYSNYLVYFEVGRVEYLRQAGLAMSEIDQKIHMPVVEAFVKYLRPARLDDLLDLDCWVSERRRASFRFDYALRDPAGDSVATGHTLHACWDPTTGKMIAIPPWLGALIPVVSGGGKGRV